MRVPGCSLVLGHRKPHMRTNGRILRLAIGSRYLGVPQSYFGVNCDNSLVDDAINLAPVREKGTCVYVIGAVGLGVVKVGWSGDLWARIRYVANALPVESVVLGIRGASSQELEGRVHQEMLPWHQKGEWFRLTNESQRVLRDMLAIEIDETTAAMIRGA